MSYPPPPGGDYQQAPQDHPRAMLSLILGIVALVCLPIIGPFAWFIGKKAVNEIDASSGRWSGRGTAQAGYILGIISTVILVLWLLFVAVAIPTGMLLGGSTG